MAHRFALIALALAGALASPDSPPGANSSTALLDTACFATSSQLRTRNADADCRPPTADDVGGSEQADEGTGGRIDAAARDARAVSMRLERDFTARSHAKQ